MATLTIHGIDPELKAAATEIFKKHGLTTKSTISAFLRKVVNDHRSDRCFCDELEVNEETRRVLAESEAGIGLTEFEDVDDLFKHLDAECEK